MGNKKGKTGIKYDIRDISLSGEGRLRIDWADRQMPVLKAIRERFSKEKPLEGKRMSCCLHVTAETANLVRTLKEGGADIALCASNPLSTQDDVAASLAEDYGIAVYAIKGEDRDTYYRHLISAIEHKPDMTQDDGADLVGLLHSRYEDTLLKNVLGGTEETTTGVIRLKSMERDKALRFPVIAVNESDTKHLFDNRYGTGQSTLDGLLRATNVLLCGKNFVVCGYGWCGRGLAMRAKGMGANVIVTEVDHIKAIEALMDGFRVMKLEKAMPEADIVITVTGNLNVIDIKHFRKAKDGVIIANSGHFNDEICIGALEKMSVSRKKVREYVEEFTLENGRKVYLLAEGRLLNLSSAEGHPAVVMDMSFANQALGAEYLVRNHKSLKNKVYVIPADIDREIARLKLETMGIEIDSLTKEQKVYLASWKSGT
ncbi:MAG: adenosylhomocysteinase [Eubacteriales bacterium]|nr:adenosylhomocysteinase [Eubacteriales bacterium]